MLKLHRINLREDEREQQQEFCYLSCMRDEHGRGKWVSANIQLEKYLHKNKNEQIK